MLSLLKRLVTNILAWVGLIHAVLFIAYWLTNSLFYTSVNDYLTDLLNAPADYISICLIFSGLLVLWSGVRLFFYQTNRRHRLWTLTTWLYGLLAALYIVFFYGSFWLLLRKSPVQQVRIGQLLLYYRVILDPVLLLGAAVAAGLWLRKHLSAPPTGARSRLWPVAAVGLAYAGLWALLLAFPPDSVYQSALPKKPLIIAHRGASMLAPENTLAAMEKAAALGTYGVETDIAISRDGVLYLMHDDDLKRTTNVAQVFPGREKDRPESFTLAEVQQLNAGDWFVQTDPYQAVAQHMVSAAEVERYQREPVPTLADELEFVRQHSVNFIFDLKELPADHTYAAQSFDITLRQIHAAGIDPQVWFLAKPDQVAEIRAAAPEMKPAYGADWQKPPDAAELAGAGYQIVNAEYGLPKELIPRYHAAGLWVNLYTIDEPWQFSRLWLLGVDSTTTSNAQAMQAMTQPILSLSYSVYVGVWVGLGLVGAAIIFWIVRRAGIAGKQVR